MPLRAAPALGDRTELRLAQPQSSVDRDFEATIAIAAAFLDAASAMLLTRRLGRGS